MDSLSLIIGILIGLAMSALVILAYAKGLNHNKEEKVAPKKPQVYTSSSYSDGLKSYLNNARIEKPSKHSMDADLDPVIPDKGEFTDV